MPALQLSGLNMWDDLAAESLSGHFSATSKHTHLLLVGSPCLRYCNTKPSLPWTPQHHSFFATDHPACQFAKPSAQLYGSAAGAIGCGTGMMMGWIRQGRWKWCPC